MQTLTVSLLLFNFLVDDALDPADVGRDLCVDARVAPQRAAAAPRHDAAEHLVLGPHSIGLTSLAEFLGHFLAGFLPSVPDEVQGYSSSLSQGFKDEDLESSSCWWAATVATYCPSRHSQLLPTTVPKLCDRLNENRCIKPGCARPHRNRDLIVAASRLREMVSFVGLGEGQFS